MILTYVQFLWQQIDPDKLGFYNGAVEAALTLCGALSAFAAGHIKSRTFDKFSLFITATISVICGAFIIISSFATNVFLAYAMYILFGIFYNFMITMSSAMIARRLTNDSFALIFGINFFGAVLVQTILTLIVVSDNFWTLDPRGQFLAYGVYFVGIGIIFFIASFTQLFNMRKRKTIDISQNK